jgi:hypothetical protein
MRRVENGLCDPCFFRLSTVHSGNQKVTPANSSPDSSKRPREALHSIVRWRLPNRSKFEHRDNRGHDSIPIGGYEMEPDSDHQKVLCVMKSLPAVRFGWLQPAQKPLEAGLILLGPTFWIDEKIQLRIA